ncbi:MAG: DUF4388 domain-containing protein, partial [Deltaproteobacteria bacterium]|nr:DUF4388 domain-containing protein [Deltaproteobacteria bacterium]
APPPAAQTPPYAPSPQRPPYQQPPAQPYAPAAPMGAQGMTQGITQGMTQGMTQGGGVGSGAGVNALGRQAPRPKPEAGAFPSVDAPDVLSLVERLVERRHDGVLAVSDPDDREGSVYFRGGHIYFASFEDPGHFSDHPLHPHQSLTRVCGWAQGRFKVKSLNALPSFEGELNEDSRSLMERIRHSCAELKALRAKLPPLDSRLAVPTPLNAPLAALSPDLLNLFQMCMNSHTLRAAVDFHPQGEREGIQALLHLLEHGYLTRL